MPWIHGVFHDFFTDAERSQVEAISAGLDGYVRVRDFTDIVIDGHNTLLALTTFVAGLLVVQMTKKTCACGQVHAREEAR